MATNVPTKIPALFQTADTLRKSAAVLLFASANLDRMDMEPFLRSLVECDDERGLEGWLDLIGDQEVEWQLTGVDELLAAFCYLTLPTTDAEAIAFALDHLYDHERIEFLQDWRAGKDVKWALKVIEADEKNAAEMAAEAA